MDIWTYTYTLVRLADWHGEERYAIMRHVPPAMTGADVANTIRPQFRCQGANHDIWQATSSALPLVELPRDEAERRIAAFREQDSAAEARREARRGAWAVVRHGVD
jgi:hypothetical protein